MGIYGNTAHFEMPVHKHLCNVNFSLSVYLVNEF